MAVRQSNFTYKTWWQGGYNLLTPDSGDGGQKTGLDLAFSCSGGKYLFFSCLHLTNT